MIDLMKISGLPIFFDGKKMELKFNGDFPFIKKTERSLEELKPYLKNSKTYKGSDPVYQVWRHAYLKQDGEKIKAANLRYDITLIPPGAIGGEFAKTAGHYHKSYPEVYEVLAGRAYFLIQSKLSVYLTEAGPREKFIIPPNFGHNTINVFNEPLLTANWISEKAIYDYESYKKYRGAMYYFLKNDSLVDTALKLKDGVDIVKNPNYDSVPKIKKIRPKEYPKFGILKNKPLYNLIDNIDKLKFLNYPKGFAALGW